MSLRTIKKRRAECKTDYKLRMGLLQSSLPRIVIRRTNRYFIVQVVESKESQDKVLAGVSSKDLLENGWSEKFAGSLKSISAAYLTGYLLAKKVKSGEFILDLGMAVNKNGGRMYAVAAGLVDGGLKIRVSEKVLPPRERLNGEHLKPEVAEMIANVKKKLDSGVSAKIEKKVEAKKTETKTKVVKEKKK